jgi:hypothetical protein
VAIVVGCFETPLNIKTTKIWFILVALAALLIRVFIARVSFLAATRMLPIAIAYWQLYDCVVANID